MIRRRTAVNRPHVGSGRSTFALRTYPVCANGNGRIMLTLLNSLAEII